MDMISKLPQGIIESILCLLPIQEAAKTSILSKEWRYNWIKIPTLAFGQDTVQASASGVELSTFDKPSKRLFYAIYQFLLMHPGPIHEFTLWMELDDSCVEIDHIILHLSKRNTVKILKLDFRGAYMLPLSLFSLHQLTVLHLNGCVLNHQLSSEVFGSLTTLHMIEIFTRGKTLLRLLSSCPLLKRLTIDSDNATIGVTEDSTIVDFIKCLPVIEYLSVWFSVFFCFAPNRLPKELPTLVHLKYLCMECISFRHKNTLPLFVLLIRSSPNLEKLILGILDDCFLEDDEMVSYAIEDYSDIMLEHLKKLEILYFGNEEDDLAVVKLILAKSPVLKNVRVLLLNEYGKDERLKISKILLSLPCASPMVKFIVS